MSYPETCSFGCGQTFVSEQHFLSHAAAQRHGLTNTALAAELEWMAVHMNTPAERRPYLAAAAARLRERTNHQHGAHNLENRLAGACGYCGTYWACCHTDECRAERTRREGV